MALVSISDAAKLVRKTRATLYRDIEKGVLTKTVLQDGDIRIDTTELARAYGPLPKEEVAVQKTVPAPKKTEAAPKKLPVRTPSDKIKMALQEERIKALERVVALEAELRRVKDQVTTELRARLTEKDQLIKTLESKILFLEFDKQTQDVPTLQATDQTYTHEPSDSGRRGWWKRVLQKNPNAHK
ncbi:MAG: hypothetical protein HYS18_14640 [Burkholderiales bacterium]|nr:hypothetical protein [Burkholderiales bacterium]